ncbi:hypothetical protein [Planococcus shenhongbingii]|uniref:Uncharacterized protein n=1 Tax=Planococcus shenhongbingii TaxID=3058398 RepID=A0ABT8NEF3_9BACL|nr:hypothetical protein [Planococcus sp. N017]MDN7246282.1 hypothetical protein [Planococcus sp. N017]
MDPNIISGEDKVLRVMSECGLDGDYHVKKTIMETGLYSLYLLSSNDRSRVGDQVLFMEHLPAQRPSAHFLAIEVKKASTTNEWIKEIREAVEKHVSQKP